MSACISREHTEHYYKNKVYRKMKRKYIIPIALAKLLLAFLVLHLFFTSCESDDLYYEASIYNDGALLEIPATFGRGDQIYSKGDTIALEIFVSELNLTDAITGGDVLLASPTFYSNFCIVNKDGERVKPAKVNLIAGEVEFSSDSDFVASFGYQAEKNSRLLNNVGSDLPYFKVEFVFDVPGDYVIYFMNVPNHMYDIEGGVDIYYNYVEGEAQSQAYAVYYFENSQEQSHNLDNKVRQGILDWSDREQASIDFTISGDL